MFGEIQNSLSHNAVNGVYSEDCYDFSPTHKWVGYSNLSIIKSRSNSPAVYDWDQRSNNLILDGVYAISIRYWQSILTNNSIVQEAVTQIPRGHNIVITTKVKILVNPYFM